MRHPSSCRRAVCTESERYDVTLCAGGMEAIGCLYTAAQPDLIVLDLMMPEMSGWESRVEQKEQPAWANIPVLALSGDQSPQARAIDATAFLSKPVQERMPELSGIDLYERVARQNPELIDSFVFLTGGAFTERARIFLKRIDRPIVGKPFARHQLLEVIEQTLARRD